MKTNFLKNIFYSLLAIMFITSCANDDDYSAPNLICEDQTEGLTANITGADLYAMATTSLQQFSEIGDDYIAGYITSSDRGGNFFKTVSIETDRKSTRLNSSHVKISYAVFCLKKKTSIHLSLGQ